MDRFFQLSANKTSIRQEAIAGLTTFLAMAYILFVNPDILGAAGMDQGAVFVATALAAMVGSIIMGLLANYPIALAPGMGLNAFFAYTVVINYGMSWQAALFAVFASGVIFIFITIFKLREKIINAIPEELKYAAGAGIGLFIAFIGLKNAGIVVGDEATLVTMGNLQTPGTLLAIFGIVVTIILVVMNIKGAVFYGLALTALVGIITGMNSLDGGIISMPPSLTTFGAAFQPVSWTDEIFTLQMLIVVLTFLFIVFFDTAGTLFAVATQAGFVKDNRLPRAGRALFADASATTVGAIFGTSTTTAYVESTSGVAVGGRTGLTAIFTGLFFLVALFFSPLLSVITGEVTAPALIVVGVMMATSLRHIDWTKMEIAVPVFFTVVTMPLTYSIATGIALGFVLYPLTMVVKGRGKELHPLMYLLFVAFVLFLFFLPH
ncbi:MULTISPECIES: NCS2 family permease [Shouchella]|uniref:Xanthine/uracil/vitamin C permease n=3 Tax=Bacillaceae TaxID=186817 RepID=A0A060M0I0_9BACI|nr:MULTISPECIES: NCS2 family permease [Bacillaceae]RQW23093.1 NCS2 family permease [Bacillus sp. C1-1]AIC93559.1 xanthine/uracil/vitamin C permease [Shouchella lehensis G1]KQL58506.1 guanine permease [Alkalicoccobacillus plakortidis]MBG9782746.1 guanine permease [Shouchella lehensis]TES49917.1 NCS2 family permease [Shouchella lehensis]